MTNQERYILLNLIPEIGSMRLRRLLDVFGSLERVWNADVRALQQVEGIGPSIAQYILTGRQDERSLEQELLLAHKAGVDIVTLDDATYPTSLKTIPDPPLALYIRGRRAVEDDLAVSIVGSRHASLYGLQCAERLSYELALRGVTVVSGLARGIDAAAHEGALKSGGRTIAVLGSGLNRVYPEEHESLANRIAEQGAVVSEYPMQMAPLPHNFPRRNRIISGLSRGVVIVEASQRSGALITADCALEQGREVFAVPGPITTVTSQGTHQLLKQGARLVTTVEDILEELHLNSRPVTHTAQATTDVGLDQWPETARRIVSCLSEQSPQDIDDIATASGVTMADVSSVLLQLELRQLVQQLPGKRFVRRKWS